MKVPGIIAKWLFALCVPFMLLTAGLAVAANSLWLYERGFEKYGVSQVTGLSDTELTRAATGLIHYFNSSEKYISVTVTKDGRPFELFNQREIDHLYDVKKLIRLDYIVLAGTLVYILAYAAISLFWRRRRYWRHLAQAMVGGSSLTLALMLLLGLGAWLDFDWLFWQFHLLSFANDLWLLDPTRDYLIMLVPQGFFYDDAIFVVVFTALGALVLGGIAAWYLFSLRKKLGQ
ncbi:MAG: TIGR01906 family membrane protein [Chloroflexota bacterium]